MIQLITIWALPVLAIVLTWIITEINFKKQVKDLDEKFYREARRIDELEKRLLDQASTIPVVSGMFSAEKVEDAYSDGLDYGMGNGGLKFHLENYR